MNHETRVAPDGLSFLLVMLSSALSSLYSIELSLRILTLNHDDPRRRAPVTELPL